MRVAIAVLLSAAALVPPAPGARAQEDEGGAVELDVRRIATPRTTGKLLRRGVGVRAACTPECVIVVKVSLPRSIAGKLGLGDPVIASGVGASGGSPVWIRALLRRRAADALEGYEGGGRLRVRVRAHP